MKLIAKTETSAEFEVGNSVVYFSVFKNEYWVARDGAESYSLVKWEDLTLEEQNAVEEIEKSF